MDKQKTKEILARNLAISLDAPRYDDDDGALVDTLTSEHFGDTTSNAELDSLTASLERQWTSGGQRTGSSGRQMGAP